MDFYPSFPYLVSDVREFRCKLSARDAVDTFVTGVNESTSVSVW